MLLKLTQVNFFQERSLRPFIKHAQCLFSSISVKERGIVGIRREDINVWERRAPFAPQHVKELNDQGIDVLVQPSTRRAYTMEEYQSAGAFIQEDLSPASVIMAVKQVPIDILIPNKSYAFFSHTIKAQEANMALLDAMLEKNIRIIDYEKMVDGKGRRVAAFGKFAGVGGMINVLHGLGLRLLSLGHHTPFMYVGSTHNYKNSRQARLSIYELGEDIRAGKLPSHFGPLVFVFTGSGNVSQGAQEVFGELPHVYVHPLDLQEALKQYDHRTLVATKVSRHHYLVPKHGGEFNAQEFEEFPSRYRSIFAEKIAPFASVIINGIYWAPSNPRLLTNADGYNLLKIKNRPDKYGGCPDLPHRLLAICDISADLGGSIEFMKECTTIEYPFALYNSENDLTEIGVAGDGLMFCSIDNIPAQLPREATDYFGKLLLPWIPEMVEGDARKPFIEETCYSNVVRGAVICSNGRLTDDYKYIMELRAENEKKKTDQENGTSVSEMKHRVLVVGAGRVSAPLIEYLTRDPGVRITSVSSLFDEVEQLAAEYNNVHPIVMDVQKSQDRLSKLISEHDLVISLLPYSLHPLVAEHCIAHRKNMMTASYVTPEMKALEPRMEEAGITVMQECGLDPGIDHMLAMQCFDQVKRQNGRVDSFMSYCGGLPAPEDAGNPMRYKFSWSPRGSLLTAMNGARYLMEDKEINIQPGTLMEVSKPLDLFPGFQLEGYPNRDSTIYKEKYGLDNVKTLLRGTLRYKNFADVCLAMLKLGCLDVSEKKGFEDGLSSNWNALMNNLIGTRELSETNLEIVVHDKIGKNGIGLQGLKELGLLSRDAVVVTKGTPLDTLSYYLSKRLAYGPGERDLVLLSHQVGIQWSDKKELRDISLVAYGDPKGHSAMAKTVSLPLAIASKMVLDGEVIQKGSVVPLSAEIYEPILKRLSMEGVTWSSVSSFD